jgi:hypothetical protein
MLRRTGPEERETVDCRDYVYLSVNIRENVSRETRERAQSFTCNENSRSECRVWRVSYQDRKSARTDQWYVGYLLSVLVSPFDLQVV